MSRHEGKCVFYLFKTPCTMSRRWRQRCDRETVTLWKCRNESAKKWMVMKEIQPGCCCCYCHHTFFHDDDFHFSLTLYPIFPSCRSQLRFLYEEQFPWSTVQVSDLLRLRPLRRVLREQCDIHEAHNRARGTVHPHALHAGGCIRKWFVVATISKLHVPVLQQERI